LHDMGHAWQALALAARAMGCDSVATGHFPDDVVAQSCRLPEDEWPMLVIELRGAAIPVREPDVDETIWYGGCANQLSKETTEYALINGFHAATKLVEPVRADVSAADAAPSCSGEVKLPPPASSRRSLGEVARMRRSALDFEGGTRA